MFKILSKVQWYKHSILPYWDFLLPWIDNKEELNHYHKKWELSAAEQNTAVALSSFRLPVFSTSKPLLKARPHHLQIRLFLI